MGIQKVSIEEDFKSDGLKRVVIATCALGMGINFPRVRYIVQYGPPKSIVDLMQQNKLVKEVAMVVRHTA